MMRLYERHKPVDLLTLTDELKRKKELETIGGSAYLTELTTYVPTSAHAVDLRRNGCAKSRTSSLDKSQWRHI